MAKDKESTRTNAKSGMGRKHGRLNVEGIARRLSWLSDAQNIILRRRFGSCRWSGFFGQCSVLTATEFVREVTAPTMRNR